MPGQTNKRYWIAAAFSALFVALLITIFLLFAKQVVTPQMAGLMVVALIGLYLGFGVLAMVYRFVSKLD